MAEVQVIIKAMGRTGSKIGRGGLLAFLAVTTAYIVYRLFVYANYGLDFSDEGYYLVWMLDPFLYDWSTTQFGFIYHPLFELLRGDIASLRKANILIIFILAWLMIDTLFKNATEGESHHRAQRLVLSAGFAIASLAYFAPWVPTPSYNSLGLQAMLITATGLLMLEATRSTSSIAGWILVGLGGWLAFMAKPTLAAALGVCSIAYIVLAGKLNLRLLSVSIVTALTLLVSSAWVIDGSIINFITRLKVGAELSALVGAGYSLHQMFRFDDFTLNSGDMRLLGGMTAVALVTAYSACAKNQMIKITGITLSALILAACLGATFDGTHYSFATGAFQGLIIWAVPFAALVLFFVLPSPLQGTRKNISQYALPLTFVVFPHAFAFGTNGNYWQVGSYANVFWLLSGLSLIAPKLLNSKANIALFPLALTTQVITVLLVQTGLEAPYRQTQALRLNNHAIEVGQPGAFLLLSDGYANYIAEAVASAQKGGLMAGTPIIDLTGQSPTLLFALRAVSLGYPWIAGGYPGSQEVASLGLLRVPCAKLASAWLLLEPDGPRSLSADVLKSIGSVLEDYQGVANWDTAEGAGSYQLRRNQKLLKPLRTEEVATQSCEAARRGT